MDRTRIIAFSAAGMIVVASIATVIVFWRNKVAPPADRPSEAAPADSPATPEKRGGFDPSVMDEIDGRQFPLKRSYPTEKVARPFIPGIPESHRSALDVYNYRVVNLVDQTGIGIELMNPREASAVPGELLTFARVTVRNCEVANLRRDRNPNALLLHVKGGSSRQPLDAELLIEDVYLHDGDVMPLVIEAGKYDTITLRRLRIERTGGNVRIQCGSQDYVKKIAIEECPGLKIEVKGPPGSIGQCIIKDSPGCTVNDMPREGGRSGVKISGASAEQP